MQQSHSTLAEKQLEAKDEEERNHNAMLESLVEQLNTAMQQKDSFKSLISHELRAPLNGIIGLANAILHSKTGDINEKHISFIKTIASSARHLVAM